MRTIIIERYASPRPVQWTLLRSLDNADYTVLMHFAASDEDCRREFGMSATRWPPEPESIADDQVICLTAFSGISDKSRIFVRSI